MFTTRTFVLFSQCEHAVSSTLCGTTAAAYPLCMLNPRHVCGHVGPRAHAIAQLRLLGHIAELPYQHRECSVLGCDYMAGYS